MSGRVVNAYLDRLLTAAEHDPVLTEQFMRVVNLLDPPGGLLGPRVMRRVVAGNLYRRTEPAQVVPAQMNGVSPSVLPSNERP
jgi:hypothetical protein